MKDDLKPLYPYAGGKRNSLPELKPYLQRTTLYVEPFFGAGAVFCYMVNMSRAKRYIINDIRRELIDIYVGLQNNPEDVVAEANDLNGRYSGKSVGQLETLYYEIRDAWAKERTAAKSLFLFNTNFGGMFQIDSKRGTYNTGSGHTASGAQNKTPINIDQLWLWHRALQVTEIYSGDYSKIQLPAEDTILFCDPPYYETGFGYDVDFSEKDQLRCFNWCDGLAQDQRVSVLFTNNDANDFFTNLAGGKPVEIYHYPIAYSAGRNNTQEEMLMVWNPKPSHLLAPSSK